MTRPIALLAVLAGPAAAHEGAHLHPHGAAELWIGLAVAVAVAGIVLLRSRR